GRQLGHRGRSRGGPQPRRRSAGRLARAPDSARCSGSTSDASPASAQTPNRRSHARTRKAFQPFVDNWLPHPGHVAGRYRNLVAVNEAARHLMRLDVSQNLLQEFFTDEQARKRHPHRDDDAPVVVARFRSQAARYSGDPGFTAWSPACTGTVRNSRNRGTATRFWRAPAGPSSCTTRRSGTSRSPGPHWTSPPGSPCVSPSSSRSPEPVRKRPWNLSRAFPAKSTPFPLEWEDSAAGPSPPEPKTRKESPHMP